MVVKKKQTQKSDDNTVNTPIASMVQTRAQRAQKTSESARLTPTHHHVPHEHVLRSKLVEAAYVNHKRGHAEAQAYLSEQGLGDYKIDRGVADNAPRKRGILVTAPDGKRHLVFRGTADGADVVGDAHIVAGTDKGKAHQKEAQETYELARASGAVQEVNGHSLGGNLAIDIANRHATRERPIESVTFNPAISVKQAMGAGANQRNAHASHTSVSTADDVVSVLASAAQKQGQINAAIVVPTEAPRTALEAGIGAHMLHQFEHGGERNVNLTTMQRVVKAATDNVNLRTGATFGTGLLAATGADAIADATGADGTEREALQVAAGGAVGALLSNSGARARGALKFGVGTLVGDAAGGATTRALEDAGVGANTAESIGLSTNVLAGEAATIGTGVLVEAGVAAAAGGGLEGAALAAGAALAPETAGLSMAVAGAAAAGIGLFNYVSHSHQESYMDHARSYLGGFNPSAIDYKAMAQQQFAPQAPGAPTPSAPDP